MITTNTSRGKKVQSVYPNDCCREKAIRKIDALLIEGLRSPRLFKKATVKFLNDMRKGAL